MRMRPIVVLCCLVLTGIGASAQKAPNGYKGAKAPFTMTISTDHEAVAANSKVVVTAHLTNVSDRSLFFLRLRLSGPDHSYRVEIYNDQGKLAPYTQDYVKRMHREPPYDQIVGGSTGPYEVEKGKTVTEDIEVTKQYDLSTPGRYTIRVFHPDPAANVDVESSNILILTVTQ